VTGSNCVARRAGKKHAARPADKIATTAAAKVQGSEAETPQSWLARKRVNPKLTATANPNADHDQG